jgi:hypothetical protein
MQLIEFPKRSSQDDQLTEIARRHRAGELVEVYVVATNNRGQIERFEISQLETGRVKTAP